MDLPSLITLDVIILLLLLHFIGDYLLQTYDMMINKGKSNQWLLYHTSVYTLPFVPFFGLEFALINGILHGITDFFSSRMNNKLVNCKNPKWFYTNMAFDQMIHLITLFFTYTLLF
jgi:hypothetical protein